MSTTTDHSTSTTQSTDSVHRPTRVPESIIVVGNGPVGFRFVQSLVERQFNDACRIQVFGEEPQPAYDRVNLTKFFDNPSEDALQYASREWYSEHQIELTTSDPIVEINRRQRTVRAKSGRIVSYDRLILATGSRPFMPPIPGIENEGVFAYRTVEDMRLIHDYASNCKRAVVLGGGLLGLEAAYALTKLGIEACVVEMAPVLMPRQLDNVGAELLRKMITGPKLKTYLQRQTTRIDRIENGLLVQFATGDSIVADTVIVSAGIRPRDELARECGLPVGNRGGIVVNSRLRTADPSIYAIGECAEHEGIVYGLVAPGFRMATTLADCIQDKPAAFLGGTQATRLKLVGVNVVFSGDYLDTSGADVLTWKSDERYTKLIVRKGRLVGLVGVGDVPQFERIQEAIDQKRRVYFWQIRRFEKYGRLWNDDEAKHVADWPETTIVCSCTGVTRGCLSAAYETGCSSVEALAEQTKASTVCGSCIPLLQQLVGEPAPKVVADRTKPALVALSVTSFIFIGLLLFARPIAHPESVRTAVTFFQTLITDSFWKQVTGYSLVTLSVLSLLVSARKRTKLFDRFQFTSMRLVHVVLATLALAVLIAHTGFHRGTNLNFGLFSVFLAGAVTGALVGLVTGMDAAFPQFARIVRRPLTLGHILCLWPLPVLVVFHIISVYWL